MCFIEEMKGRSQFVGLLPPDCAAAFETAAAPGGSQETSRSSVGSSSRSTPSFEVDSEFRFQFEFEFEFEVEFEFHVELEFELEFRFDFEFDFEPVLDSEFRFLPTF